MILQDPMASLNPLFTIGNQVAEPIIVHEGTPRARAWERARQRFVKVMPRDYKRVLEQRAAQEREDTLAASGERG